MNDMSEADLSRQDVMLTGHEGNQLGASIFGNTDRPANDHPLIVMMHGGGQTRHSWNGAARQLAARGNIAITVDARGHGESEWPPSKNYTFESYRDDLIAISRDVPGLYGNSNKPPVLVGASMGGISAMMAQAAIEQGAAPLFSAIVLVDITPRMQSSGVDRIMGFMAKDMRRGFGEINEAADAIAAYLPNRTRPTSLDGLSKNLRQREDGRWYWHWDPAFVDGPHNIMTGSENRIDVLLAAARKISVPALLVRGGKSELVAQEDADEFLALVPHAKYVDVTDAGHMVAGDRNDIFAAAVIEFLEAEGLA
ncbi:MAG: alpha/beta hydrolase [Rhizobiaceae bacterium]